MTPRPWITAQLAALQAQRSHALLLHGPSGLGQYQLALELARAFLCATAGVEGGCGACISCHALDVRTHSDLFVLMPETVLLDLAWPLGEKAQTEIDDKKRKPSKEIRIEAMRDAIEFAQRTSGSGRGKVVLVYPAERMNAVTANALLKTLEEPPGNCRFILASESAQQLLPTIRSRCLACSVTWPAPAAATRWLLDQGVDPALAETCLRATGGRPDDALRLSRSGNTAAVWAGLPRAVQRGEAVLPQSFSIAETIDCLQKICHDLQLQLQGVEPRYFLPSDLPLAPPIQILGRWSKDLSAARRTAEHPFNPGLMTEALLSGARNALNSRN